MTPRCDHILDHRGAGLHRSVPYITLALQHAILMSDGIAHNGTPGPVNTIYVGLQSDLGCVRSCFLEIGKVQALSVVYRTGFGCASLAALL